MPDNTLSNRKAALVLNVHLRTVFRKVDNGQLVSKEGRITTESISAYLQKRESSRAKPKKVKGPNRNIPPEGYVWTYTFQKLSGLNHGKLKQLINGGVVKSEMVDGKKVVPQAEYERIRMLMDSTVRPSEAEVILGKKNWEVRKLRSTGVLTDVDVLGRIRIDRESVDRVKFGQQGPEPRRTPTDFPSQLSRIQLNLRPT